MAGPISVLADEDFDERILAAVRSRIAGLDLATVKSLGLRGKPDNLILNTAFEQGRLLISHDARTMPIHAARRLEAGQSITGLCIVPQSLSIAEAVDEPVLVIECSTREEWLDRTVWLPL